MRVWMIGAALMAMGTAAYAQDNGVDQNQNQGCIGAQSKTTTSSESMEQGTGGSSTFGTQGSCDQTLQKEQVGQAQPQTEEPNVMVITPAPVTPSEQPGMGGAGQYGLTEEQPSAREHRRMNPDLKGVTVQVGGGVEGYTGQYGADINPGPGWNALADIKPWKAAGIELNYSGAANDVDHGLAGSSQGAVNGADIVRNGGQAAVILQTPTAIAPYVLGGVGFDHYNYRGVNGQFGFRDNTNGNIPVALGVRATAGHLNADLRAAYNYLWSDNFSPVTNNVVTTGRYAGTLQVGGSF